jgi:hypothetical protein
MKTRFSVLALMIALASCSNDQTQKTPPAPVAAEDGITMSPEGAEIIKSNIETSNAIESSFAPNGNLKQIIVGEDNFKALVAYVEKHGTVSIEKGIPSDRRLVFADSKGNRHVLITIKRDENGQPSLKGKVVQISVWCNTTKGDFVGYVINSEEVYPLTSDKSEGLPSPVAIGYSELLTKVTKS